MGNKNSQNSGASSKQQTLEKFKLHVQEANTFPKSHFDLSLQVLASNKISRHLLPLVWKYNKNVIVEVIHTQSNSARSVSHFTPKEFYILFALLTDIHKASQTQNKNSDATEPTTTEDNNIRQASYDDNECSLCMEAKVDVVTTCAHAFCNECLSSWKLQNKETIPTCPICRGPLARENSDDRLWVLEESDTSNSNAKTIIESMSERVTLLLTKHLVTDHVVSVRQEDTEGTSEEDKKKSKNTTEQKS